MTNLERNTKRLEAYNEAKKVCSKYVNYKGDKRSSIYKNLSAAVDSFAPRMNANGKMLGLPTFNEYFYNK